MLPVRLQTDLARISLEIVERDFPRRAAKKSGKLRALKPGKAVITGKYKKGRYKVVITVKGRVREKTQEKTTEKSGNPMLVNRKGHSGYGGPA